MGNIVEEALNKIAGYFSSLKRNTEEGTHELEVGIPANWVYKDNNYIGCEIIHETNDGKLLRIYPKTDKIVIDDLINFVTVIIGTNKKIAEKEAEFQEQMELVKKELESRASKFYDDLDILKKSSFNETIEDSNDKKD